MIQKVFKVHSLKKNVTRQFRRPRYIPSTLPSSISSELLQFTAISYMGDRKPSLVFSERLCRAKLFKTRSLSGILTGIQIRYQTYFYCQQGGQLETLDSIRIKFSEKQSLTSPSPVSTMDYTFCLFSGGCESSCTIQLFLLQSRNQNDVSHCNGAQNNL